MTNATSGGHPLQVLESPVRRRLVDLLANTDDPVAGMTAAQLGAEMGLHTTTARFHLDQLEASGLVESFFRRQGVGRPRKVYRLPANPLPRRKPGTPAAQRRAHEALNELLVAAWDTAPGEEAFTPEEAGRQWAVRAAVRAGSPAGRETPQRARTPGGWLGKVGATVDLLHQWGYVPELRTLDGGRTAELTLVDCPLLELAEGHPDVVCAVHRGLLRGALEAVGEDDTEVGLRPLVAPRRCLATVTTRASFTGG